MTQQEAMAEIAKRKPAGRYGPIPMTSQFPLEGRYVVSCGDFYGSGASWNEAVANAMKREAQNV